MNEDRFDVMEKIEGALVQHGACSDRVYVMKLGGAEAVEVLPAVERLAEERGYTKIFAKVDGEAGEVFAREGFELEARVPGFYCGDEDGLFLGKFLSEQRAVDEEQEKIEKILEAARGWYGEGAAFEGGDFELEQAGPEDAEELAGVYREVFESYPFPIHEAGYIRETMDSHIDYFVARDGGDIVAAASAEMDIGGRNVEMTDFATLEAYRGNGLGVLLLGLMEERMREREMVTAYTIARALSGGMNVTFSKLGYDYGGTLTNNTGICGGIESMNVWWKKISKIWGESGRKML